MGIKVNRKISNLSIIRQSNQTHKCKTNLMREVVSINIHQKVYETMISNTKIKSKICTKTISHAQFKYRIFAMYVRAYERTSNESVDMATRG